MTINITISSAQLESLQNYHLGILAKTTCTLHYFANIYENNLCMVEKELLDKYFPKIKDQPTVNNLNALKTELVNKLGKCALLNLVDTILTQATNTSVMENNYQILAK